MHKHRNILLSETMGRNAPEWLLVKFLVSDGGGALSGAPSWKQLKLEISILFGTLGNSSSQNQ